MTSEIQKRREELENLYNQWGDDYNQGRTEGFNLGVELAQKEFLDILTRKLNQFERGDTYEAIKMLNQYKKELKQSIEGEK